MPFMIGRNSLSRRILIVAGALLVGAAQAANASLPPGQRNAPRLVSPETGVLTPEGALKFAWIPTSGAIQQALVVSEAPFETQGWSALPSNEGFRVFPLQRSVVAFSELGIPVAAEKPLYWAVGSSSSTTGRWTFSDSRSVRVAPRFAGRMPASPFLEASPIGKAPPVSSSEPRRIRLAAGYEIDPTLGEPAIRSALREGAAAPNSKRNFLVHYGDADADQVRKTILESGGTVVAYVPDRTFLVRMKSQDGFSLPSGGWVGTYQPAYKLSADLEPSAEEARMMTVLAFPDASLDGIAEQVAAAGGRVIARSEREDKILRVEMGGAAAVALARNADVEWIEPYMQPVLLNTTAQWIVQTGANGNRRIWTMGLEGLGEVFHHSDSGIDMTHEMYSDPLVPVTTYGSYPTHRKVITYENGSPFTVGGFGDHAGASYHGSHTSGTVAGQDLTVPLQGQDGMARLGKIWHSDLADPSMANGLAPPVDLNDLFQPSYTGNAGGAARISTNSWGAPVSGNYTVDSYNVDKFMWNHPDYLIFFASGNSGSAMTVGSPATAKNCVTVGGTRNSLATMNSIYTSTSRGPTADGRRKPTICAPASALTSSFTGPNNYQALSGTSMGTPCAAGNTGLMREYLREGWYPTGTKIPANGFNPSAALLKAMVINSGQNVITGFTSTFPNNDVGYGRMNIDSTLFFSGDLRRLLLVDFTSGLGNGQSIEYKVNVNDVGQPLEVSLCWTDFPADPAAGVQLVNDLNLTVTNGVGTFKGNVFSGGFSTVGGSYDNRNVEEAVLVKVPSAGVWTIRIDGASVPVGPQPFGLCITGGVGTNAGSLALDRAAYGSTSTVALEVTDTNAGGSVNVTLTSNSEPAGETVTLPGANGSYAATIPLSPYTGSAGDGTLQVSNGDVITATYQDASPAATLVQTATVSINRPVITNVSASSSGTTVASVSWNTNINASSKVYYGLTPALGSATTVDPAAVLSHSVTVGALSPGQSYYCDVESVDLLGNLTRDDNGGQHYRFSVRPPGDLLLVYGGGTFERDARYRAALDSLGWFYDVWTDALADAPPVGNLTSGLRSYDVVWWQPQLELYPPVADGARDSIDQYLNGGGRFAIMGQDLGWSNSDPASDYYTPARQAWVVNSLHSTYVADPAGWTQVIGVAADPISAPYTGGLSYAEHRAGASGDEVTPGAGAIGSWNSGDGTPATCAVRWESPSPVGSPGSATWGGKNTRLTPMFFEWSNIDPLQEISTNRKNVLQRTLTWLLGRDKPNVTITAPNAGVTIITDSYNITWTEILDGAAAAARTIEYSVDGGASWNVLTTSAGPSPYSWDVTNVPNTQSAKVRVRVTDDGDPAFTSYDLSNGLFAIQRAGGDLIGPAVTAGSIQTGPNPIVNTTTATITATLSDVLSGASNIAGAEWSAGPDPVTPGGGQTMSGSFDSSTETATATIPTAAFTAGTVRLWVRGRDAAGNWGNASYLDVVVNGNTVTGASAIVPRTLELRPSAPNPVEGRTTITYALPRGGLVSLAIYDVSGRKVRTLARGDRSAGVHSVAWDRTDEGGHTVQPGVYFTRLDVRGQSLQRKIVTLR
jgi:hypothetical protein